MEVRNIFSSLPSSVFPVFSISILADIYKEYMRYVDQRLRVKQCRDIRRHFQAFLHESSRVALLGVLLHNRNIIMFCLIHYITPPNNTYINRNNLIAGRSRIKNAPTPIASIRNIFASSSIFYHPFQVFNNFF